jgi:hypothetical protein
LDQEVRELKLAVGLESKESTARSETGSSRK